MRAAGSSVLSTSACRARGIANLRRGRGSSGRSPAGGWRMPRGGGATPRCSWPRAVMTCAMCAPTARRGRIVPASAVGPMRLTPSGSRARCWRTRCCPRRSSAPARIKGPDESHQLLALWHNRRRSILTSRQHLVNEAEHLLCELPLALREQLPDTKAVRPRLAALEHRNRRRRYDAPTRLRLQLLDGYRAQIIALDRE